MGTSGALNIVPELVPRGFLQFLFEYAISFKKQSYLVYREFNDKVLNIFVWRTMLFLFYCNERYCA